MKVETSTVLVKGTRIVLAFPPAEMVAPGIGDRLIHRLSPYYPTLPIMLVSLDDGEERAHAFFKTSELLTSLSLDQIQLTEIDLAVAPPDRHELPF